MNVNAVTEGVRIILRGLSTPPQGYTSLAHIKAARNMKTDKRALDALEWAAEMSATVAEMKAWDRAQHGEDLSIPEQT